MSGRSTISAILLRLQARLRAKLVTELELLPDDVLVQITAQDPRNVPHFQAGGPAAAHEVLLWPRAEQARDEFQTGGGRLDHRSTRIVHVVCRTRLDLDQGGAGESQLTSASLGHFRIESAAKDALALFTPLDEDDEPTDELTDFPLHWLSTSAVEPDRDASWVSSQLAFAVPYLDAFISVDGDLAIPGR